MTHPLIDLTLTLREGMTTFPVHWHPMVEISQLGRLHYEGRETRKVVLGTHTGTHIDAPRHFIDGGNTIDQIDIQRLVGPCALLDFTDITAFGAVDRARMMAALGGRTPERIMMRFDWDQHYYSEAYYSDHPFLTEDCAKYLVEIGVKLLAMDTPMPDDPKNNKASGNDSPNHLTLLGAGVLLVEYVTNLAALGDAQDFDLIVAPLKIQDGDGAPVRCFGRRTD